MTAAGLSITDCLDAISTRLAALEQMPLAELRVEWRRLTRSDAPLVSRDLLVRALAFREQERRFGGLSPATRRRIEALTRASRGEADAAPSHRDRLRPGARLVREWHGRTHTVIVAEYGFEWDGRRHASLTAIARAITGARWSGPRFFGLVGRERTHAAE